MIKHRFIPMKKFHFFLLDKKTAGIKTALEIEFMLLVSIWKKLKSANTVKIEDKVKYITNPLSKFRLLGFLNEQKIETNVAKKSKK